MATYTDWDFYKNTYLGTDIDEDDFVKLALRASATLDALTFDRIPDIIEDNDDAELIALIEMATCSIADEMQSLISDGPVVASERIGQQSVSYVQNPTMQLSDDDKFKRAAKLYLGRTGIMFQGFESDEYGGTEDDE